MGNLFNSMDRKDCYSKVFLKEAGFPNDEKEITQARSIFWFNQRHKQVGGLRLTEKGLEFIENDCKIKTYEINIPKEITISPQILIWLDKYLDSPYYIEKNKITVISEKTAIELHLFSGDLKKYGTTKTMAKRSITDGD
jgi:hypothetical protein